MQKTLLPLMTSVELVTGFRLDVRVHTTEESLQSGLGRVAEIIPGVVDIFERLEERVVVVGKLRYRARLQEWRQQHGSGSVATVVAVDQRKRSARGYQAIAIPTATS